MTFLDIIPYLFSAVIAVIAVTLHELAHGFVAYKLGDPTAKEQGRLTFNPIKHIDPFGLLALIVFRIGWAKPVPINPNRFRSRKKGMILVSLAGPFTNLALAFIFGLLTVLFSTINQYAALFCYYGIVINTGLAIFNLLPLPPLDGSKILASVLPSKWEQYFYKYERYLSLIVIILYFTGIIRNVIVPIIDWIVTFILNLMW